MLLKNIWRYLQSVWDRFCNRKIRAKSSSSILDTAFVSLFGLEITVTREITINGPPYELTIVVPRAELRMNKKDGSQEIILSSITIAHSPRLTSQGKQWTPPAIPRKMAA
jgi:hypothetical protein